MKKTILLASAATGVMLSAAPAYAGDQNTAAPAATADSTYGSDIVVTARRREENLSKVPVAVTAFSSQQIETKNITNVTDLTKLTPGLNITGGGTKINVFVTIRGQSRGVTGNVSPGVLTYFNEVPLPTYGSTIPTYDMESLQVLKGPQGTLFGRNSIGGAVLTYSKAPNYTFNGYVKGEIGQYANRSIEGAVNIPIVPDKVALRVAGQLARIGGWGTTLRATGYTIDPVTHIASPGHFIPTQHNDNEYDSTSFRASLLIEPVEGFKNVTVFDYVKLRGSAGPVFDQFYPKGVNGGSPSIWLLPPSTIRFLAGPGGGSRLGPDGPAIAENIIRLAQCGTSPVCDYRLFQQLAQQAGRGVNFRGIADPWAAVTTIWGLSNTTTLDISDNVRVKNIFGYRTNDSHSNIDVDGSWLTVTDPPSAVKLKIMTEELQLSGNLLDGKLKYTLGGFYFKQSPNGLGGNQVLEVNALFGISHNINTSYFTDTSKAVYGQVDYDLGSVLPGLSATAGYRQTWDTSGGCVVAQFYSPFAPQTVLDTPSDPVVSEATCRSGTYVKGVNNTASSVSATILPPKDFRKGTYNLSLNYQASPNALIYLATRRGYRAGSYNSPLYDGFLSSVQTFAPETLTDYELGTKLRFESGSVWGSLDAAGYIGKGKGIQLPLATSGLGNPDTAACIAQAATWPGSTGPTCTTNGTTPGQTAGLPGRRIAIVAATTYNNAGDATITGFELDAKLSPVPGLVFGGGLAHVHFTTDRIGIDPNLLIVMQANGKSTPKAIVPRQQPAWLANASMYYEHQQPVLGGKAFFNADLRYRSDYFEGEDTIKGSTVVDARAGINNVGGTNLDVAVNVINVFNKDYDYGSAGSALSTGYRTTLRGDPRTVSLSLRYKWGS
jgi:iron complex outermembrane receptor protein